MVLVLRLVPGVPLAVDRVTREGPAREERVARGGDALLLLPPNSSMSSVHRDGGMYACVVLA